MVMAQLALPVGAAYARLRGHAFASGRTVASEPPRPRWSPAGYSSPSHDR